MLFWLFIKTMVLEIILLIVLINLTIYFARTSKSNTVCWNIFCYDRTGTNDGIFTYGYIRKNDNICSQPYVITYCNRERIHSVSTMFRIDRMSSST